MPTLKEIKGGERGALKEQKISVGQKDQKMFRVVFVGFWVCFVGLESRFFKAFREVFACFL